MSLPGPLAGDSSDGTNFGLVGGCRLPEDAPEGYGEWLLVGPNDEDDEEDDDEE